MSRKLHLTRWLIVALAVVVALGSIGVTYARWSGQGGRGHKNPDTYCFDSGKGPRHGWWSRWGIEAGYLSWSGNNCKCVETDPCNTEFIWVVSNDDGEYNASIDPGDDGGGTNYDKWGLQSSDDPSAQQVMGSICARYDKDVAKTTASVNTTDPHYIEATVNNAYPSYYPTIFYGLKNKGTLPGTIQTITVDEDATTPDVIDDIDELTVTVTGIYVGQEIAPSQEVIGDLDIHVEQCAAQNHTYTIRVIITLDCEEVKEKCDTAYAYGGCEYATCFIRIREIPRNRNWGWTNGPLPHGSYEFDIYAGAAQCRISKGELVGTLTIDYYVSGNVIVTYNLDAPYTMDETQLYVGNKRLPKHNGRYTVSPGKYPYTQALENATEYTYELSGFSGKIYVIAHGVVCRPE